MLSEYSNTLNFGEVLISVRALTEVTISGGGRSPNRNSCTGIGVVSAENNVPNAYSSSYSVATSIHIGHSLDLSEM